MVSVINFGGPSDQPPHLGRRSALGGVRSCVEGVRPSRRPSGEARWPVGRWRARVRPPERRPERPSGPAPTLFAAWHCRAVAWLGQASLGCSIPSKTTERDDAPARAPE